MNKYTDSKLKDKFHSLDFRLLNTSNNGLNSTPIIDNRPQTTLQRKLKHSLTNIPDLIQARSIKNFSTAIYGNQRQLENTSNMPIQFMLRRTVPLIPATPHLPLLDNILQYPPLIARMMIIHAQHEAARQEALQQFRYGIRAQILARFFNINDPVAFLPPVMRDRNRQLRPDAVPLLRERLAEFRGQPQAVQENMYVDGHASADQDYYPRSPQVSATDSILGATQSTDDNPGGVQEIINNATHIAVASVPRDLVHTPVGSQQRNEGEQITEGTSFRDGIQSIHRNPFENGNLRLSRLTPQLIELLTRS